MRFTVAITEEANIYVAQCLEVDVASQGALQDEALANLKEALALSFEEVTPELRAAPLIASFELDLPTGH